MQILKNLLKIKLIKLKVQFKSTEPQNDLENFQSLTLSQKITKYFQSFKVLMPGCKMSKRKNLKLFFTVYAL